MSPLGSFFQNTGSIRKAAAIAAFLMVALFQEALSEHWHDTLKALELFFTPVPDMLVDGVPCRQTLRQQGLVCLKALQQGQDGLKQLDCIL